MAFTALFDACVLYPAPLRDILLRLACGNLFRARWSAQIHDEWIRSLLQNRPDLAGKLQRTRDAMDRAVADCLVTGHEVLIPGLILPDPNDRHVLAAAILGRADVIVTFNLKDFPAAVLGGYGIEAQHPDVFIRHVLDLDEKVALHSAGPSCKPEITAKDGGRILGCLVPARIAGDCGLPAPVGWPDLALHRT